MQSDVFKSLGHEVILESVEACGVRCTGRIVPLNSMENRVFAVEVESDEPGARKASQVIIKFYRPGRWTPDQILSEHILQLVLSEEDIPTARFLPITNSAFTDPSQVPNSKRLYPEYQNSIPQIETLGRNGIFQFCVWEKVRGRPPLDLTPKDLQLIGRIVARMHNLFESHIEPSGFVRHSLSTELFGMRALENVRAWGKIPNPLGPEFFRVAEDLVKRLEWVNNCMDFIPTHGDLHRLNLLQTEEGGSFWLVDFDDCMWAPDIQDLWLLSAGCNLIGEEQDDPAKAALNYLLSGYEEFRAMPEGSTFLVEPLRTLRMIYYYGWIANRWGDPAFQDVFSFFRETPYWERALFDMETQKESLERIGALQ